MTHRLTALLAAICLVSCVTPTPAPSNSEFAQDLGGGFVLSGGEMRYAVTIQLRDQMALPLAVRVEYENPRDKNAPIVENFLHEEGKEINVTSPPVYGLKYRKVYSVTFLFNEDPIMRHISRVQYNLPPEVEAQVFRNQQGGA